MLLRGQVSIVALSAFIVDMRSLWVDITLGTFGPLDLA